MSKKLLSMIGSLYVASCFLLGGALLDNRITGNELQALESEISVLKVKEAKASTEIKNLKNALAQSKLQAEKSASKASPESTAMNVKNQPLGMRYCNPGNVKVLSNGQKYTGQVAVGKKKFVIFSDKVFGIRAIGLVLLSYQYKHGIDTVEKIIYRYSKTDREKYISFICKRLGVKPNQKISIKDNLPKLLECIVTFEVGTKHEKTIPNEMYVLAAKGAIMDKQANILKEKKS